MNNQENNKRPLTGGTSLKRMALLHLICCGGMLLIFVFISTGVAIPLAFLYRALPYLGIVVALLAAGVLLCFFQR